LLVFDVSDAWNTEIALGLLSAWLHKLSKPSNVDRFNNVLLVESVIAGDYVSVRAGCSKSVVG